MADDCNFLNKVCGVGILNGSINKGIINKSVHINNEHIKNNEESVSEQVLLPGLIRHGSEARDLLGVR